LLTLFFTDGLFYPEDGGDTFLVNVGSYKTHTAPRPRRAFFIVTVEKFKPTYMYVVDYIMYFSQLVLFYVQEHAGFADHIILRGNGLIPEMLLMEVS
jgi:hypothetical protein